MASLTYRSCYRTCWRHCPGTLRGHWRLATVCCWICSRNYQEKNGIRDWSPVWWEKLRAPSLCEKFFHYLVYLRIRQLVIRIKYFIVIRHHHKYKTWLWKTIGILIDNSTPIWTTNSFWDNLFKTTSLAIAHYDFFATTYNKQLGFCPWMVPDNSQSLDWELLLTTEHRSTSPLDFMSPMFGSVGQEPAEEITRISLIWTWVRCPGSQRLVQGLFLTVSLSLGCALCRLLKILVPRKLGTNLWFLITMKIRTQTAEVHWQDLRNIWDISAHSDTRDRSW